MKYLLRAALCCAILIGVSCQKDEGKTLDNEPSTSGSWKIANLKEAFQNKHHGFVISKAVFEEALALEEVQQVRFALELKNNMLHIRVLGVDEQWNTTSGILVAPKDLTATAKQLHQEQMTRMAVAQLPNDIGAHILQPATAHRYISSWAQQWGERSLSGAVSYDNERIRHFTMPAAVVRHMIGNNAALQLLWGLNDDGKLTTVFLPELDKSALFRSGNYAYDFTRPCPTLCNDK